MMDSSSGKLSLFEFLDDFFGDGVNGAVRMELE
jgi:hypothetical protein